MRARGYAALAAFAVVGFVGGSARAGEKVDLDPQVKYAVTWDAAVEEAKLLNVPIIVHSHGFYCGPCWGLHSGLLKNKKYIEFSEKSTVEVICLSSLQDGIDKKDARAETYEVTEDGKKVEYMVEFPGMTQKAMLDMASSKGGQYNQTGKVPYTCIVNPYDLSEVQHWEGGSVSAGSLMDAITEYQKSLVKEHGKGIARKDVRTLAELEKKVESLCTKGDFAAALTETAKVASKAKDWPEAMTGRLAKAKDDVVGAAKVALDEVEAQGAADAAEAKKALGKLAPRLKGTGLEERAKALLASWSAAAPAPAR